MHLERLCAPDELKDRVDRNLKGARERDDELRGGDRSQAPADPRDAASGKEILEAPAEGGVAGETDGRWHEQIGDVRRPERAPRMIRQRLRRLCKVDERLDRGEHVVPRSDEHGRGDGEQPGDSDSDSHHDRQVSPYLRPVALAAYEPIGEHRCDHQQCGGRQSPDRQGEQHRGADQPPDAVSRRRHRQARESAEQV